MKTIVLPAVLWLATAALTDELCAQPTDNYRTWALQHVEPSEVRRMLVELMGNSSPDVRIIADDERNELLLMAPVATQRLAEQLIEEVDLPGSEPPSADNQPVLRTYTVDHASLNARLKLLRKALGENARISVNRRHGQIVIVAIPRVHQLAQTLLQSGKDAASGSVDTRVRPQSPNYDKPVRVGEPSALFPTPGTRPVGGGRVKIVHQIQHYSADRFRAALKRLLKDQLDVRDDGTARYTSATSGMVNLRFDAEDQSCELQGDREIVDQFLTLFDWFERVRDRASGESIHFVPLRNVRPDVLNRAIHLWRESSKTREVLDGSQSSHERNQPVRRVAYAPQDPPVSEGTAESPVEAEAQEDDLRPPLSGVSVQPFPGLDVLAIQGKEADVEELIRIIREIERLSDESAPEIELYFLKHVQSGGLSTFIRDIVEELTEPLQGRVAMVPIAKPNALLIIGWGEAVEATKKLIDQLDQPVSPDRDMKIFPLENAGVAEVVTALQQALDRNGGLAPGVAVTPNPRTNSLIVYAAPRDMQEVARLIRHLDADSSASVSKGRMIRLKNSLATDVATTVTAAIAAAAGEGSGRQVSELEMLLVQPDGREIIASGILNDVTLTPDARTNTIFITGPEGSLTLVERLIEHLDESPAASAVIKVFEIANGNAADLVIVLRTLFPVTAVGSGVPALATAEGETSLVPVRFSVDARTNTIIATGTSSDLQVMEALLIRLDEVASQERVNEVYHLRNTPATAVAQAVNDFLQSERIVNQAAPGRQNLFEQIQQEVVVVPEIVRNQLIISATPRFFDQIMELVENLDSKPPQVLIQVILAEVLLDNFHELGVELGIQDSLLFDRSLLGDLVQTTVSNALSTPAGVVTTTQQQIVSASNTPGFNFNNNPLGNSGSTQSLGTAGNVGGQGLSSFTVGRTNSELGYGGLVLSASSENVSLLLRALDRTGSVEILSRPQIMTLDNQEAFIQVGQSVPRIASSSVTQFGQVNTVEDTEVGLLLGVIPRINPDGTVVMQVDATKSEVGPEAQGIPIFVSTEGTVVRSPRVNITSAQTTVSASSGQTIVIGGLITTNNTTEHRKVPWLGDLPALGKLFRYDSYANRRTELLIILTPHVVLGRGDADYLKQIEMSRMSWVSSDVFELIGPGSHVHRLGNDSGVEVIYPDATPGLQGSVPAIPPALDSGPNAIDPVPMDSSLIPNNELNPVGSRDEFSIEGAPEGFSTELDQVIYRKPTSDSDSSRTTSIEKQPAAADRREEKKNGQRFFDFNRRRR
ncbi:MAG: secretin N-terminal domain-containing protein [Planctomycetaceae bacterium]